MEHRRDPDVQELRQAAGVWLRNLRERQGLSQRDLAKRVGAEYYTLISQLETGRGRIASEHYDLWAKALGTDLRLFVKTLLRYYEPQTYGMLFSDEASVSGPP